MAWRHDDDVVPSKYLEDKGSAGGMSYARVALPHTSALWKRLDSDQVTYGHRGHLHIGSQAILPQPFGSPASRVDRQTTGVPRPMTSHEIERRSKRQEPPSMHKNQTLKQHSIITRPGSRFASTKNESDATSSVLPGSDTVLDLHYQLYGKSSYQSEFRRPRYAQHRTLRPTRRSMPALMEHSALNRSEMQDDGTRSATSSLSTPATPAVNADAGGSGLSTNDQRAPQERGTPSTDNDGDDDNDTSSDDESAHGLAEISRHPENGKLNATQKAIKRMLKPARFPPIPTAAPPSFQRSISEENMRRTRKLKLHELSQKVRPVVGSSPFPRPYRQATDGERIRVPDKRDMLQSILQSHPSPKVNVGKSLFRSDTRRHTIAGLRNTWRPADQLAKRWH